MYVSYTLVCASEMSYNIVGFILLSEEVRFEDLELVIEHDSINVLTVFPSNEHAGDAEKELVMRPEYFNQSTVNATTNTNKITTVIRVQVFEGDTNCASWIPTVSAEVIYCILEYDLLAHNQKMLFRASRFRFF